MEIYLIIGLVIAGAAFFFGKDPEEDFDWKDIIGIVAVTVLWPAFIIAAVVIALKEIIKERRNK